MSRCFPLVLLALLAAPAVGQGPAYQRHGSRPAVPPPYYGRGPAVEAGSFQRPYPYHLDYYKQRYGGSYEPYFGNLYGPPNVVLGVPYGGYAAPVYAPPAYGGAYPYQQPAPGPEANAPVAGAPTAGPTQAIVCPHCHQPIYLAAPPAAEEP